MSGAEYAAGAAISTELRSTFAAINVILSWFLIACLGGWLVLLCISALKKFSMKRNWISVAFIAVLFTSQMALGQPAHPLSRVEAKHWSVRATVIPVAVGAGCLGLAIASGSGEIAAFGAAVGGAGVAFGPGAGHVYAKQAGRFWTGVFTRAAAGGVVLLGVSQIGFSNNSDNSGGFLLMALGSAGVLASAVYDIATVGGSVDKYNRSNSSVGIRFKPGYIAQYNVPALICSFRF